MYCILPDRGFIRIAGVDAVPFLQGIVTNNVARLEQEGILYSALLTPQGKFLHDFFLIADSGAILIDCEGPRREDLFKRLSMYKLRSKVTLELVDNFSVAALWKDVVAPSTSEDIKIFPDPRLPELGYRLIGEREKIESFCVTQNAVPTPFETYEAKRIEAGVPDGSKDLVVEKTLLLECGFELLHGVDFSKGCYVGQEVTARSKFRAQLRKSLYIVTGETLTTGTPVTSGDTIIGELKSTVGNTGLAILQVEEVEKNTDNLHAGNIPIKAAIPSWMISH